MDVEVPIRPQRHPSREYPSVGYTIGEGKIVVNYFLIDSRQLPAAIFHYHLGLFKRSSDRDEELKEGVDSDLALTESDPRLATRALQWLIGQTPEWHAGADGRPVGITYDGRTAVFSTRALFAEELIGEDGTKVPHRRDIPLDGRVYCLRLKPTLDTPDFSGGALKRIIASGISYPH